ncbi:MAG: hypothetical protein BWY29_00904 [Microgenomates group bacterium ADurb.Bin238]|nr:MAG: hypothetical protein BWY29_00904 [Microgenomates group bacterium ADurb.Bin238]
MGVVKKYKTRGWSKWGGGRLMMIKSNPNVWRCQACGEEQPKGSPAYLFPIGGEDYIRICSNCEHKVIRLRIVLFTNLKKVVTKGGMWVDNMQSVQLK